MERSPPPLSNGARISLMQASYDRRKIGRQASWPADLRRTSADAGAYRTHVGPYHPPSMERSSRCMPTTLPLYLKWNNLLSFDREQLIFTYVVGGV